MSCGPKAVALTLTEVGRAELQCLLRRCGIGQALAQWIRVVLACAEPGATNLRVAETLGVSRQAVATWRGRFAEHRLEGWWTRRARGRRGPSVTRQSSAWSP